MTTALVVVVALVWILQVVFSIRYWKKIPDWVRHPYGRMAQLGSWCHITMMSLYLTFIFFGRYFNPYVAGVVFISAFVPLVVYGVLQLILLERSIKETEAIQLEREKEGTT